MKSLDLDSAQAEVDLVFELQDVAELGHTGVDTVVENVEDGVGVEVLDLDLKMDPGLVVDHLGAIESVKVVAWNCPDSDLKTKRTGLMWLVVEGLDDFEMEVVVVAGPVDFGIKKAVVPLAEEVAGLGYLDFDLKRTEVGAVFG